MSDLNPLRIENPDKAISNCLMGNLDNKVFESVYQSAPFNFKNSKIIKETDFGTRLKKRF